MYCTLHCTFSALSLSLARTRMKVRDYDVLVWVQGQRKVSQVLGAFGLLDFTMLRPILAWHVLNLMNPFFWTLIFQFFPRSR
jgi:hypothetical protein